MAKEWGPEPDTLIDEDEQHGKGFVMFPKRLLYAKNLSRDAKLLWAILVGYAHQEWRCFPGYKRLCEDMGASENMVRKYMRELESVDLLHQTRRGLGHTNLYRIRPITTSRIEVADPQRLEPPKPQFPNDKEELREEETHEEDHTYTRKAQPQKTVRPHISADDEAILESYLHDYALEFGDKSPASSLTRVANLWQSSGLALDAFCDAMQRARTETKLHYASIKGGRMPYFFGTLKKMLKGEEA